LGLVTFVGTQNRPRHCPDGPDLVGYQLMAMHIEFGQRLADQATGALFYALNVRNP
jgi:hypothetical protein